MGVRSSLYCAVLSGTRASSSLRTTSTMTASPDPDRHHRLIRILLPGLRARVAGILGAYTICPARNVLTDIQIVCSVEALLYAMRKK